MTTTAPIKVLIADDHRVVREGLQLLLSIHDDIRVIAAAGSGQEAIAFCERLQPDVVLMDLAMPDVDGTAATRLIRERHPATAVLVLTSFLDEDLLRDALEAGANGYLLKSVGGDVLVAAIRAAVQGRPTLDPATLPLLMRSGREPALGDDLTTRERDVLKLLTDGKTNREIGAALGITAGTVRIYVSNVLAKLRVSNRTKATSVALQHGLVRGQQGRR